jgi:hypothetical protein
VIPRPLTLALLLWSCAATAQTREGADLPISTPSIVKYGQGTKWTAKLLRPGTHKCSNATFGGDPAYGIVKQCITYPVNRTVCELGIGVSVDASYGTSGAWMSQWCPLKAGGHALHIVAGKWLDAAPGVVCFLKGKGSSTARLALCAPGDVTSADLAPTWSGDALRIANTAP